MIFLRNPDFTKLYFVVGLSDSQPLSVIAVVTVFVLIGLLMDRRAFVTSGLISLGVALGELIRDRVFDENNSFWLVLATIGFVVLTIGVLWPVLRRLVVQLLPNGLRSRLPPVRA